MKRILLLGSYGRGNVGDDAFLAVALNLFPDASLFLNSAHDELLPREARERVQTISTTSNSDLSKKIRVFRQVNHIVYFGGDLWVELYGDRFPRQALYKMVVVNLIARLFGKKVHYMGCGIGSLQGYSLFLARLSAWLANGVAVREPRSAKVLGLKKVQVLPDLVTTLDIGPAVPSASAVRSPEGTKGTLSNRASLGAAGAGTLAGAEGTAGPGAPRKFTVGVSILYHLPNPEKNFPKCISTLAKVLRALPVSQYRIVLFPMLASPDEEHDDVWACEQLRQALPHADVSIFSGREVDEYVAALTDVDVLIGTRLHANIIALLAGVPSIGISYRPKVAQFFAMAGLEQYCIDLTELTPKQLEKRLQSMQANRANVLQAFHAAKKRITAQKGGYQDFVAAYF